MLKQTNRTVLLLGVVVALVQVFDILIHAATDQLELIRVASNIIMLVWVALAASGRLTMRFRLSAAGFTGVYLLLNVVFLALNGVTNEGDAPRTMLFVLITLTVILAGLLTYFGSIRVSDRMTENRRLDWDGCSNVRDLGGLRTRDGRTTRWGAVVRSDHPAKLTSAGWSALYAHGIRTIISLYTQGMVEDMPDTAPRPADLTTIRVAVEDVTDTNTEFVQQWGMSELWCTPLYYRDALKCWPERHAAAISAIAHAQPGGVLIHCKRGVDRTGIVTLLLLALAGVAPDDILADYELSVDPEREALLTREHTSTHDVIYATLDWLDIDAYLLEGGLSQNDLTVVRARLLEPTGIEAGG